PPFCAVCLVTFSGQEEAQTAAAASSFGQELRLLAANSKTIPLRVLGPAPAALAMLNGRYRYKLTIKCRNDTAFRALMAQVLRQYHEGSYGGKVSAAVDFNSDCEA
ncbi:MAG: primosomal protein N', partial [Pygmaiobacter sp.]